MVSNGVGTKFHVSMLLSQNIALEQNSRSHTFIKFLSEYYFYFHLILLKTYGVVAVLELICLTTDWGGRSAGRVKDSFPRYYRVNST